jgi:predicted kinase
MLILMAGLPGTGKTTLARQLAERLNATVLSKDTVRHALFPPELVEYTTEQDDFVIEVLLRTAEYIWKHRPDQVIILDGRTFSRESQRQRVINFAGKINRPWRLIECVCSDEVARQRLAQPDPSHPAGNRAPQLFEEVKQRWEPIEESKVVVRTDEEVKIESLLAALR